MKGGIAMKEKKTTPRNAYVYSPHINYSFKIYKPMPMFVRLFWMLLGFKYLEEEQ